MARIESTDFEDDDAEWVAETFVNVAGFRGVMGDHVADRILHRVREPFLPTGVGEFFVTATSWPSRV